MKEELENLKITEAAEVDIPLNNVMINCKSKNFQGGEDMTEVADMEKAEPKEVVPQKDECTGVNIPEEGSPREEENSENKNPTTVAAEASKKNKKKKKKVAPATSEEIGKKGDGDEKKEKAKVLGEIDDNKGENVAEVKPFNVAFYPQNLFLLKGLKPYLVK